MRQLIEVVIEADLLGRGKRGEMILAEFNFDITAIGDFQRPLNRAGTVVESPGHFLGGLEIELVGFHLESVVIVDGLAGLDT